MASGLHDAIALLPVLYAGVNGEPSDRERVIIVSFWQGDASCVLLSEVRARPPFPHGDAGCEEG